MTRTTLPTATKNRLLAGAAALALVGAGAFGAPLLKSEPAFAQTARQAQPGPSFSDTVEKVRPAVFSVKVKVENAAMSDDGEGQGGMQMPDLPEGHPLEKFFRQFGGRGGEAAPQGKMKPGKKHFAQAQGSGFFISADGYGVTNNHVVDKAVEVSITMDDGKTYDAKVIGRDPKTDLALIKVKDGGKFPFVKFAEKTPRVGDWVIAVGNPFGLGGTVTAGIVSARGRDIGAGPYDDFIQIDAAVNRGNSGGPTFNIDGEVIGVNTAIVSPSGGNVGIAFAVPTDTVTKVVASLKDTGTVERGYAGVQIQPITDELADSLGLKSTKGALVSEAQPGTPAADAGIKSGDTIVSVNGEKVDAPKDVIRRIGNMKPGEDVKLGVIRDGKDKSFTLKLAAVPGDRIAKAETSKAEDDGALKLGVQLAPVKGKDGKAGQGVQVVAVDPDGLAAEQGLRKGDIILEIAGKTVTEPKDVKDALVAAKKDGKKNVVMRIRSGEGSRFVAIPFPKA
jgi:serine protease Do